ncbi:MAG TPA: tetratricopeptide repeat protein, partial [Blastocatellia bacterium]|nr:tetratricopeptide repeat protein [Blastocatellia bacterium]
IFLTGLGETNSVLNDKSKAREQLEQGLKLWRELKEQEREAATLALLAGVYAALGDKQKAEEIYRQALSGWKILPPR